MANIGTRMLRLLSPDVRSVARAELRAAGLDVIGPPAVTAPADGLSGWLRSAATVLDGDAVLSTMTRPDWTVLAAEHRREPFGRVQRRALIARSDCPDALTGALLTPWDSLVAGRLVARRQPVPRWTWQAALTRIGEVRPSFLRHVLSDGTVEEMILTTPRLDLLVRAVDGYDHNHHKAARTFWECVGGLLRDRLGTDRSAWPAAAAALPSHPGTLSNLLRRVGKTPSPVPAEQADLRILAHAPDAVLADVIAGLPDPLLAHMERRDLHPRRTGGHLTSMVLDRFVSAGIPPRALFARWACNTPACTPATRAWAHGLNPLLDRANKRSAAYDVTLRRLLAAGSSPPVAASDLVGALRACADPIESEALLTSALGENGSPPWRELLDAHRDSALPPHLLCALAAREGFPETLAQALPAGLLPILAGQSPAAARTAVTALHHIHNPWGLLHRIRAARVLSGEELLARSRPARHILQYASTLSTLALSSEDKHGDDLLDHCARLFDTAARSAPAGFWPALLELLPAFGGTLPELLDAAAAHPRPSRARRPGDAGS
ncbi:hypothetical protein [Streptosporangium sp. LJ11]|uniref:hypothetical protein n=1 Tax=Streptosporangium sp. LJ11 TaxID=3436927 RepID=UPI003F7B2D68